MVVVHCLIIQHCQLMSAQNNNKLENPFFLGPRLEDKSWEHSLLIVVSIAIH